MTQIVAHHAREFWVRRAVTDAPAGHGVALGNAVDNDGAVFDVLIQRCEGDKLNVVINQIAIDFIRNNVDVLAAANLRNGFQFLTGINHAGRVAGRIKHKHLGFVRDRRFQLCRRDLEVLFFFRRHDHRHRARLLHHFRVADPVRRRDDHLIARIAQCHQCDINRVLRARSHNDLLRLIVQTEIGFQPVACRFAQLHQTGCRRIAGLVVLDCLNTGLLDVLRGRKIRLARAKADHILAFGLHLLEQRVDDKRRRCLYPRRDSGNRFQCHCSALPFRLSMILLYACRFLFASLRLQNCKTEE